MKGTSKEKLRNGLLALVAIVIVGYLLVAGVWELTGTKDLVSMQLIGGEAYIDVEHSAMGIIPIGKDHYFIGVAEKEETAQIYLIRAGKNWTDDTFGKEETVTVSGLKKRFDYDVEQEISKDLADVEVSNLPLGTSYYVDVNYKFSAIMKIAAGLLFLMAAALAFSRKLFKIENNVMNFLPAALVLLGLVVAVFGIR